VLVTDSEEPYTTTHELWKSDGTDAGTVLVQGFGNYYFDYLTTVNNTLYFTANSYDTLTNTYNKQLWEIDGANGNVSVLKDLGEYSISQWEALDNNLYFQLSKYDSSTYISTTQLWKTDGTDIGTTLIKDFPNSSFMSEDELGVINNTLYFQSTDPTYGTELWMSNGTETGTMMVADINPGKGSSNPSIPVDVNGTLYLLADDGIHGNELWKLTPTQLGSDVKSLAMSNLKLMSEFISTYQLLTFSNPSNGF
jgi:ELWxxDGT repeat protein